MCNGVLKSQLKEVAACFGVDEDPPFQLEVQRWRSSEGGGAHTYSGLIFVNFRSLEHLSCGEICCNLHFFR
eukprot:c26684_g1_i1 orf=209-421(+)